MSDPDRLRAEAEALAAELPDFPSLTRDRSTAQHGGAPRQRAGHGEDFWQYRGQTPEDSANSIDWRRSATGDDYFIREHELQTARLLEVGVDVGSGFNWAGAKDQLTKAQEAKVILTSLAIRFVENGDLAAVLGSGKPPARSGDLSARIIEELIYERSDQFIPNVRRETSAIIYASDFYGDLTALNDWVRLCASNSLPGVLLQVIDPLEAEFPFSGRVKFKRPGGLKERIFGRTEDLKDDYFKRFMDRQYAVKHLAEQVGWHFEAHIVGEPRRPLAFRIMQAMAQAGVNA
ncbi:MAG: hypothetical protein CMK09_03845 [Ponticaulis sp.]|nr:hypothetical protein [Ponticaulis sp.]|tara:strand:- start:1450 stop:2319 length:870 start_codon:yes stop_codon:yes gene_type:complete